MFELLYDEDFKAEMDKVKIQIADKQAKVLIVMTIILMLRKMLIKFLTLFAIYQKFIKMLNIQKKLSFKVRFF